MSLICDYCNLEFQGKGYLLRHIESKHLTFKCDACEKVYKSIRCFFSHLKTHITYKRENLDNHTISVHEQYIKQSKLDIYIYPCRYCERKFKKAVHRNSHEMIHKKTNNPSPFKCETCSSIFLKKDELRSHFLEVHYTGSFYFCSALQCDRYFTNLKLLKIHEKIHSERPGYQCQSCKKTFRQSSNYSKHKRRCKGEEVKQYTEEQLEEMSKVAQKQFEELVEKNKSSLRKPREKMNDNKDSENVKILYLEEYKDEIPEIQNLIHCTEASNPVVRKSSRRLKIVNEEEEKTNEIVKKVNFKICDKCGIAATNLPIHIKTFHEQTLHECEELGSLKNVHAIERKFICDLCGSALKAKQHLKNHLKKHEPPSKCPICFKYLPNIEAHIKRHQQKRTKTLFICVQCNREYATKQVLNEHQQRVHEKKSLGKFYNCLVCGEKFIRNSDLRRHSFIHYKGKVFSCTQPGCSEMFKSSHKLNLHQVIHMKLKEKNFPCDLCDRKYFRATALNKHKKKSHN